MRLIWTLALLEGTLAATVTYNWSIGWVRAAPDGVGRSVIGILNYLSVDLGKLLTVEQE